MKKYYRLFFRVVCCICAQCFTSGSLYKSFGFDQVSLFRSAVCMYVQKLTVTILELLTGLL